MVRVVGVLNKIDGGVGASRVRLARYIREVEEGRHRNWDTSGVEDMGDIDAALAI